MAKPNRYRGSGAAQASPSYGDGLSLFFAASGTPKATNATGWGGALNQAGAFYGIGVEQAVRAHSTGAGVIYLPVNQEGAGTAQATTATATGVGTNTLSAPIWRTSKSDHEIRTYFRR